MTNCLIEVRSVDDSYATVSCYLESGEVIGKIRRSKFPCPEKVCHGMVFFYDVEVLSSGETKVLLHEVAETTITSNDIIETYNSTVSEIQRLRLNRT